ncbi:endospore germination permease [Paenibacillus sp. R14(2021)]|uniref:GerAB/ArcD/ProY family transporter n=1 Tax=Paenibacillus sp. R14(2021) TaxID=2859228 RepID=UPI001C613624|nr:endospore germination permease [Paenibacillus sp. R14(2021)]
MKDMRFGGKQLFWLMSVMQAGMTILLTINPTLHVVKQDAWISTFIAGIIGVWIAFVCSRLSLRFPKETFVEYVVAIAGKWAGNALIGLYLLYWYSLLAIILRQYADFVLGTILPHTPLLIPIIAMLLVAMYVTHTGIEVIARCSELFGPFILLGILIPLIMAMKDMKLIELLPMYVDSGIGKLLTGALPTTTFLGDCVMLVMLYAFVNKPGCGTKYAMLGVGAAAFLTCMSTFLIITVLGVGTGECLTYPFFHLVRYVTYFDFIQNLDSLVIAIWIVSVFLKVSLYYFISTYGTAQWLKIKRWRRMSWMIAPLALLTSLLPRNFVQSSVEFPQKLGMPFLLPFFMLGMPMVLLGIAKLRNKGQGVQRKN